VFKDSKHKKNNLQFITIAGAKLNRWKRKILSICLLHFNQIVYGLKYSNAKIKALLLGNITIINLLLSNKALILDLSNRIKIRQKN
jgi:hypothetical protein